MTSTVEIPDSAGAVTRLLAVETSEGPGETQEVIVQARGYPRFRVPRKYFDGKGRDEEVGRVMPARVVKRMDFRRVERGGREIQVIEVEAEDAGGRPLGAQVSEEVAPTGVCRAGSGGVRMEPAGWGTGARTRIDGAPRSFYLRIFEQIGRGL